MLPDNKLSSKQKEKIARIEHKDWIFRRVDGWNIQFNFKIRRVNND